MHLVGRDLTVHLNANFKVAGIAPRPISNCGELEISAQVQQNPSRWFVAQTHPRKEMLAVEHLARQGFATFFPRFRFNQIRRRRSDTVLKPVFPGYLFVAFDLSSPGWTSINSTRGVRRLVGSRLGRPQPVPANAMNLIRKRCRGEIMVELLDQLHPGDLVQINTGPLANRIARVERLEEGERVALLFEIMGTEQVITIDQGSIGPISTATVPVC